MSVQQAITVSTRSMPPPVARSGPLRPRTARFSRRQQWRTGWCILPQRMGRCTHSICPDKLSWPERESHALARSRIHLLLQEIFYAGAVTVAAAASPAAVAVVPAIGRTLAWVVGIADHLPGKCQAPVAVVDSLADTPVNKVVAGIAVAAGSAAWLPGSRRPLSRL